MLAERQGGQEGREDSTASLWRELKRGEDNTGQGRKAVRKSCMLPSLATIQDTNAKIQL